MKAKSLTLIAFCCMAFSFPAAAVVSTGTVNATLTLTNGCLINGSPNQSGIQFGTLDFGTHPATFSTLSATFSGSSGSTFGIQCTSGVAYTVVVTSSTNTAPTTVTGTVGNPARYLVSTTDATQGIAYSLYSDAGLTTIIPNGLALTKTSTTGSVDNYTLYGGIQGGGNSTAVKAGTYNDVINITVNY